jgi:hypothetical protein
MNLRNIVRWLSQASKLAFETINQRLMIVTIGALFLLAGFAIVTFLLNFDQLQRLAEQNGSIGTFNAPASSEATGTEWSGTPGVPPPVAPDSAEVAAWLSPLNRYRAMVGLAPVAPDAGLSRGDLLHSHYLAVNYAAQLPNQKLGAEAHAEDPVKPGFTFEGAAAARASDVDWKWDPRSRPKPSWAIHNWMQAPFHRMQIISPYLHNVGYGSDCQGVVCFAALNTGTDVNPPPAMPSRWPQPLVFPPDGAVMDSGAFSGEWPDPLTSCPGYTSPAGLPVTVELGHLIAPVLSDYSLNEAGATGGWIDACAFDASTYVNPDPAAQGTARAILSQFGAIVIVPRRPLPPGRYVVTLTAGKRYTSSFSIDGRNPD